MQWYFLLGAWQDPFWNEGHMIYYQTRYVREFLYGWLEDTMLGEDVITVIFLGLMTCFGGKEF
jgi:hypothetical protein